jgi:hypothetical protein
MKKTKINWKISMLWYWVSYFAVTVIGVGHTIFNGAVLKMETMAQISQTGQQAEIMDTAYGMGTAYAKTVPFHPLYNIIIWPLFAFLYFRMAKPEKNPWRTALFLGLSWSIITIVFDVFGWVIIRHPWAMTWKAFYIDYQPWITLIYLAIFASPFIGALIYKNL